MKNLAATGGLAGFLLVLVAGMMAGRDPGFVLIEASLAAVLGASLLRWLNRVLLHNVHAALVAREQANEAALAGDKADKSETMNTL